ncbi:ATP synthase delta chain, chloroplastic-like [Phragmites australis]|uniref:ATP synthase delta chain, chloroplastic-like n=1 Tax=Phragmites australis TaxID=29695 RepID=UPI002D77AC49|nr:ATP synthase delta chain, chloroplastic-like [Phragmites australis]
MNILNQPINPGGHPVFPAAKDSGQLMPASVRFDGVPAQPSTAAAGWSHAHSPRWQAQTLRRASSYVGIERDGATAVPAAAPAPPFKPLTLDFLRSLLDRDGGVSSVAEAEGGAAPPAPPPQLLALRVVVTSAVELEAPQTELIARKMRRITGFVNLTVENVVDPSLIAGFIICYGTGDSHVIDLSVKGQLAALKNRVDSIDQSAHALGNLHH